MLLFIGKQVFGSVLAFYLLCKSFFLFLVILFLSFKKLIMDFSNEHLTISDLRKLQSQRLKDLVTYLDNRSPFYQQKFKLLKLQPKDIRSIEDLSKLPITYKQDLRDNYPFGLMTVPKSDLMRIHCSSGSTGKPTVVVYTKEDMAIFNEVVARSLHAAGARPGMQLHNAYGYGLFTGGLGLHGGAERLGMSVLPISGGNTTRQVDLILDFQPEVICCSPSYALTIADEVALRGISPKELSLKFAVLGSEAWTNVIRNHVNKGLGVRSSNIYGLSEIIGPGVANEDVEEPGASYLWEDHFFPEILDAETKEPLPLGEEGVLVLTTLTKRRMPLLRYWTNDITSLYYDPKGKRSLIKMNPIKGRSDDMLIIRGVNVYPSQIEEAFSKINGIVPNYYLTPIIKEKMTIGLEVDVEISNELVAKRHLKQGGAVYTEFLEKFGSEIKEEIKKTTGISTLVRVHQQNALPKNEGGKINRVLEGK